MRLLNRMPRWLPTAIVCLLVLYATLSSRPVGDVRIQLFKGADKVVHFIMFATLASVAMFDVLRSEKRTAATTRIVVTAVSVIAFGAVDELLQQYLTDNRSAEFADWLADIAGVLAAIIIFSAWLHQHRHADRRPACRD